MPFDIAVIGGGPAGATLARLVSKKFKVLVIDKKSLESGYPRCFSEEKNCGGLLAPDAQKMLAKFGLGLPKDVLVEPQLFSVKAIDIKTGLMRHYQRHYINIDRLKFDRWLLSLASDSVEYEAGAFYLSHSENDRGCEIFYRKNGNVKKVFAKMVVGADGASSSVRRNVFPGKKIRRYLSVQEWHETGDTTPYFSSIFDGDTTDFYSWTIPKNGSLILGSAFDDPRGITEKLISLKKKLVEFGFTFKKDFRKKGCYLERPESISELAFSRGKTAMIGEAGGFISPSSAEGLSYAFWSALNLAKSLEDGTEKFSAKYARNSRGIAANIAGKILKSPFMFNPFLRETIMKLKLNSVEVLDEKV